MALTAWTIAVVALVVVGVVAAETEPDSVGDGIAPSNDQLAGLVIFYGLVVLLVGVGLISLVAWHGNRIRRRHRSGESDSRRRHFTSSL